MSVIFSGLLWLLRFAIGGCVFGFYNVVIYRLPAGEGIACSRSHCPACHFLMELAGGLLFICCGAYFGCGRWGLLSLRGLIAFTYLGILTIVAFIDWDTRIIYNRFHIGIALLGIASLWLFPEHMLTDRLIGAAVVAVPMLALTFVVEGAFGGGDIKLMAVSGFLLGWRAVVAAMFIGFLTGGAYCVWMLSKERLTRKDSFAFGPFLSFGLGIAFFWGDKLVDWYLI